MKYCPNCNSEVESNFNLCWNCNYSFNEQNVVEILDETDTGGRDLKCLRCEIPMRFTGNYDFHEGPNWMWDILENKESFDIYLCPKCGKVEFFSPRTQK